MVATQPKKVVVAVDSSVIAESALQWAAHSGVLHPEDEVHLVTVVKPVPGSTSVTGDPANAWLHPPTHDLEEADKLLKRYQKEAQAAGLKHVAAERVVAEVGGSEGIGITLQDYAKKSGADTMVVGSRGLGSLTRPVLTALGLGSVSDYCVRHAPCNIVVHRPAGEQQAH